MGAGAVLGLAAQLEEAQKSDLEVALASLRASLSPESQEKLSKALAAHMCESVMREDIADDSIKVRVLGMDGAVKCSIVAKLDWKIAQVKKEICNVVGGPVAELKLICGEKNLFNDVVLRTIWGISKQVDVSLMRISKETATEDSAATMIQSIQRAREARKDAVRQREVASKVAAENSAATKIQSIQRAREARKDAVRQREVASKVAAENSAATKIQSIQKAGEARKEAARQQEVIMQEDIVDDSIQICVLGIDGERKCTIVAKLDWKIAKVKKEISNVVGSPVAELKLVCDEKNLFNDVVLRTIWGAATHVVVSLMRISKETATTDSAATKIQSIHRAREARKEAGIAFAAKAEAENSTA